MTDYLLPNRPVVISDGLRDSAALYRWNLEYLLSKIGDIPLPIAGDFFNPERTITFSAFIGQLATFETLVPLDFDIRSSVPYLRLPCPETGSERDRASVFARFRDDWTRPYFLPRSLYVYPFDLWGRTPNVRPYPEQSILISARGACTGLHVDRTNDTALLCQVAGVKVAYLFPPTNASFRLVQDEFSKREAGTLPRKTAAARNILAGREPAYESVTTYRTELRAGDVLYIPKRWPHEVFTIETSISLTYNFMHVADLDWPYLRYRINERFKSARRSIFIGRR
jgi:hypothetical protein